MKIPVFVNTIPLTKGTCCYETAHAGFLLLGAYFTFLSPVGVESLSCYRCIHDEQTNMCMDDTADVLETCSNSVITCAIATGIRKNVRLNGTKLEPCMGLECSKETESAAHALLWKQAQLRGNKMVCETVGHGKPNSGLVDRQCYCGQDRCNRRSWNEIMVQPLILPNHTATDTPVVPTLGVNALDLLLRNTAVTTTSTKGTDQGAGGSHESTTRAAAAEAGDSRGGGLSPGLLAGVAIGGLFLLGLIGAGIYWFKFRKRQERESDATGVSNNSAGSDASEDDDEQINAQLN